MARITSTKMFRRMLKERANKRIRAHFDQRVRLFQKDPYNPLLNVHALKHRWKGHFSFSLTDDKGPDDYRVIYKKTRRGYRFVEFGTHDQVYRSEKP